MSRDKSALPHPTMGSARAYGTRTSIISDYDRYTLYAGIVTGVFFGLCIFMWLLGW